MELKSILYCLVMAFIMIAHQTLAADNILSLLKDMVTTFVSKKNFTDSFNVQQAELVHYIAVLILCATEKESERC